MAFGDPTIIQGDRSQDSQATNREDPDFARKIALLDPNENPFTLITMDMSRRTSQTIDFHWFEDELVPETSTFLQTSTAADTTWDVAAGEGVRFAVGDLVMHNISREVVLVISISTDELTVLRDFGSSEGWTELDGTPAIGDFMTIIGNAFEQGHELPDRRSTREVEMKNYCQDQRTPIGLSEIADASKHRGEDEWPYQLRKAGISHDRKIEYQNWWGKPNNGSRQLFDGTHDTGDDPATGGGINHFMEEEAPAAQKIEQEDLTLNEFQDALEFVFEFGSAQKFCYCPPRLRSALDHWGISKLHTFVNDSIFGMNVQRWDSSHGEVIFINTKMLKNPDTNDFLYSFFLDMNQVKWVTFSDIGSTQVRDLDPYRATGATLRQSEYQTISGLQFGLAPNHARLKFKTFS